MSKLDASHAELLMKVYELRREEKLRKGREWMLAHFWADTMEEFNALCPPGSDHNAHYRQVTTYWEMVALIVNRGMIDEEFFFESTMEGLLTWLRVKNITQEFRKVRKNPLALKNLETLAEKHEKWLAARAPEALQTIHQNFQAMRKKATAGA